MNLYYIDNHPDFCKNVQDASKILGRLLGKKVDFKFISTLLPSDDPLYLDEKGNYIKGGIKGILRESLVSKNIIDKLIKNRDSIFLLDVHFEDGGLENYGISLGNYLNKMKINKKHIFLITSYYDKFTKLKKINGFHSFTFFDKNKYTFESAKDALAFDLFSAILHNGFEKQVPQKQSVSNIIYFSKIIKEVIEITMKAAQSDANILILGESGTGKGLFARAIYSNSLRKNNPFVTVDCSAIPATLMESELFGHEKGAFTGAISKKIGQFELAKRGTIFLDEIGEIPLELQSKLLRVLQDCEFKRVGGLEPIKTNVRVIAATSRDLDTEKDNGTFRKDLYYRLNVIKIELPPLKNRKDDIRLLANHFLVIKSKKNKKAKKQLSVNAIELLEKYKWPGNVRELENCIEHAVVMSSGLIIEETDFNLPVAQILPQQSHSVINENQWENASNILFELANELTRKKYRNFRDVLAIVFRYAENGDKKCLSTLYSTIDAARIEFLNKGFLITKNRSVIALIKLIGSSEFGKIWLIKSGINKDILNNFLSDHPNDDIRKRWASKGKRERPGLDAVKVVIDKIISENNEIIINE